MGADIAHAARFASRRGAWRIIIELGEIVGHIGILGLEAGTTRGEIPVVLAIILYACTIAEEMLVDKGYVGRSYGPQFVAIVHIVPAQAHLHVEMTHVKVDRCEFSLELVIEDVVGAVAFQIDVDIVLTERITERRSRKAARMDSQLTTCHQAFAKAQRDIGADGDGCLQRDVESQLHSSIFLSIVAHTSMELHRFAGTSREDDTHTIVVGHQSALGRLIEQIDTHGRGDGLLEPSIYTIRLAQMEFLFQETLILRRHIPENEVGNALFLSHHLWTQGMQDSGTERLFNANTLFQGNNLVPMAHSLFLAITDEGVDGLRRETDCAELTRIDIEMQVCNGNVVLVFIDTVDINNLAEHTHGALDIASRLLLARQGDTNHDVGSHVTRHINGVVVAHTTIDQHLVAHSDWREGCRNGH